MITLEKMKLYASYRDIDSFGRSARKADRELMSDEDWWLIDALIGDAAVIVRKLGSEQRTNEAKARLVENCENEEVIEKIKRLATGR